MLLAWFKRNKCVSALSALHVVQDEETVKLLFKITLTLAILYTLLSALLAFLATSTFRPGPPQSTDSLGFPVENVEFRTADGILLKGWYSQAEWNGAAVILVHGYNGTRSDMVPIARTLALSGVSLLLFDLRGCGQSTGTSQTLGTHESKDVVAAIEFLENGKGYKSRGLAIIASGTGASATILAHERVKDLAGAVLLGPYYSLNGSIETRFKATMGPILGATSGLFQKFLQVRVGTPVHLVKPGSVIDKLAPCPILLVGAGEDQRTPPEEIAKLSEAAGASGELYIIPGVSRERMSDLGGSDLKKRIVDFINAHLN